MTTATDQRLSYAEEAARLLARKNLIDFVQYVDPRFKKLPPHVPVICKELQEVVRYAETGQGVPILIIELPPRHLKTTTVAELLPAYFLGRNPEKKVIITSYAASLSYRSSKNVRSILETSREYQDLFGEKATSLVDQNGLPLPPVDIRFDSRAMDHWVINQYRGEFQAVGVGGPVTGHGANLIVIDDPYANRAAVESQVIRDNVKEYFLSTLYTRREKNCAIVLIMQLWREDDLAGLIKRLSNLQDPDFRPGFPPVKVLKLPAIAEKDDPIGRAPGAVLWPEMYDSAFLSSTKAAMGDYYFNSQYQQRPTAPEGNIFKRPWFPVVPRAACSYKIQYWDTAEKKGEDNDFWACATIGVTSYGLMIFDYFKQKMTANEGEQEIRRRYDMFNTEDEPIAVVWIEEKSTGAALVPMMQTGDSGLPIAGNKPKGDKVSRANAITAHCSNRRVVLQQHCAWISDFLDDMTSFPNGPHDDGVDAVVGGVSKLILAGYTNPTQMARQLEKAQQGQPMTGGMKRAQLFGRDGKGVQIKRAGVIRRPPNFNV